MKKLLAISFILLISNAVFSQDLIITNKNDSLNCIITKVDKDFLYFTYSQNGESQNSIISREEVNTYYFSYSEKPILSQEQINMLFPPPVPQWRVALRGGYSWGIGSTKGYSDQIKDYISKLKNGYHVGADVDYFFSNATGVGAKYTYYKNKEEDYWLDCSDDMNYHFIAPVFIVRSWDQKRKNAFIIDVAAGYLSYFNKSYVQGVHYTFRAKTFGLHLGIGYEYALSKNIAIGGGLSYLRAMTSSFDVTEDLWAYKEELDDPANLGHLDVSLYLVFNASKK